MFSKIYAYGSKEIDVSADIAIFTKGSAKVYYYYNLTNMAPVYEYNQTVTNGEVVLTPGSSVGKVRIDADAEEVLYETGSSPEITLKQPSTQAVSATVGDAIKTATVVRNTIADSGTVTVAQHRDQVLYQDASGGAVTMTSATGSDLAAEFADIAVGDALLQYHASNHASNTSTISGGTGVTLVGSGAVTQTGGTYLLIKTAAATFDLVRVG